MRTAAILGGTGFVGGELLRLLTAHPEVEVRAVASNSAAGKPVHCTHPNLRGVCDLRFVDPDDVPGVDVVFSALPHGQSQAMVEKFADRCHILIDLAADFRLSETALMARNYGWVRQPPHLQPFAYGLPEVNREELASADHIAVAGCMASAAILALYPLARAGLLDGRRVGIDARTGSSGSGARAGPADMHCLRSGALRVFAPVRHRHQAEIEQLVGVAATMTATGTNAVRGVQVVARVDGLSVDISDLWGIYRHAYDEEHFVRLVAQRRGPFRLPDPKVLLGSNFCDIGFDSDGNDVVVIAALDNLVKGAAGNAVQCMNARLHLPEPTGLGFAGLHPV